MATSLYVQILLGSCMDGQILLDSCIKVEAEIVVEVGVQLLARVVGGWVGGWWAD